jgi:hypothetical protein
MSFKSKPEKNGKKLCPLEIRFDKFQTSCLSYGGNFLWKVGVFTAKNIFKWEGFDLSPAFGVQ